MKRFLLLVLLVSAGWTHAAPAPTLIPFQGRLTDQVGNAYTNGQYTLIFNLYDQAVGGAVLWTETHQRVGVVNGVVNVFLGSINPALSGVDFSQTRYLGITIDPDNNSVTADPEMVPRQMIIPAFWAKMADDSSKLAGYSITDLPVAVPVGGVIMWWGNFADIPLNYELCDGLAPETSGATLGGTKPDLREKFVRAARVGTLTKAGLASGGTDTVDLRHQHGTEAHDHRVPHAHGSGGLWVPIGAGHTGAIWWTEHGYDRGLVGGAGYDSVRARERGAANEMRTGTAVFGDTDGANPVTTPSAPPTDFRLSQVTENRPAFQEMFFIIRVK